MSMVCNIYKFTNFTYTRHPLGQMGIRLLGEDGLVQRAQSCCPPALLENSRRVPTSQDPGVEIGGLLDWG